MCVCVQSLSMYSVTDSLQPHGLKPSRLLCPWDFLGKNIGVGCHFLLHPEMEADPGFCSLGSVFTFLDLGSFWLPSNLQVHASRRAERLVPTHLGWRAYLFLSECHRTTRDSSLQGFSEGGLADYIFLRWSQWRLPWGPVAKTPCSQCMGPGFNPWTADPVYCN